MSPTARSRRRRRPGGTCHEGRGLLVSGKRKQTPVKHDGLPTPPKKVFAGTSGKSELVLGSIPRTPPSSWQALSPRPEATGIHHVRLRRRSRKRTAHFGRGRREDEATARRIRKSMTTTTGRRTTENGDNAATTPKRSRRQPRSRGEPRPASMAPKIDQTLQLAPSLFSNVPT